MQEPAKTSFSDDQFDLAYPAGIEDHYWYLARHLHVLDALASPAAAGRVLDVGCGRGITVRLLAASGYDCFGVEVSTPRRVETDVAARLFVGQGFEDLPVDFRALVETVTLLDVIEHIDDDVGFLRNIRHAFPALRAVVATVPARREIWSNYDVHYGHFRRYELKQLEEAGTAAGFQTDYSGYLFRAPYLAARVIGVAGLKRNTSFKSPSARSLHRVLAHVLHAERILPRGVYGSSAIVRWSQ
jgi:SAM-dependent methyltransferase